MHKNVIYKDIIAKRKKAIALMLLIIAEEEETYRSERRVWTTPYLLRRKERSLHHNLLELAFEDPNRFRRCLRMNTEIFENLLEKTLFIQKQDTILRESIPPEQRLSLTLRHLATGVKNPFV